MESPWHKTTARDHSRLESGRSEAIVNGTAAAARLAACSLASCLLLLTLPYAALGQTGEPVQLAPAPQVSQPEISQPEISAPEVAESAPSDAGRPEAAFSGPQMSVPSGSVPSSSVPSSSVPSGSLPADSAADNAAQKGAEPADASSGPRVEPVTVPTHHIPVQQNASEPFVWEKTDRGIALVARDASLSELLSSLAHSHNLNLVLTTSLDQRVTVSLRDRTLQQTLDAVLAAGGLTWAIRDDVIYVSGSGSGSQSPYVQGRQLAVFELDYTSATEVEQAIGGLLSPAGKAWVSLSSGVDNRRTKEVVTVEDLPPYLERIENYILQLDQPPRQVLIEAHVLQIELDDDNRHGVNFKHIAKMGSLQLEFETKGLAEASPQAFFLRTNGPDITGLLEALKTTTDAKTLASPRVVALNGQESRIQVGEQLGFRVTTTTETSTLESVEFLDVGVVLTVTPRISRDGLVLMRIRPEVSRGSVDPQTGLPEEETTEVETDVLLPSGSGIVIGGLIQETDEVLTTKYFGLGDIPYIGPLFKRRAEIKNRQEIVIAIVPHILPLPCPEQARNDFDLQRARTPLFDGPLVRHPRPYEPRLPDRRLPREREAPSDCPVPGPETGRYVPGPVEPWAPQIEFQEPQFAPYPPEILPPMHPAPAPGGVPSEATPSEEEYFDVNALPTAQLRRLPAVDSPAVFRR